MMGLGTAWGQVTDDIASVTVNGATTYYKRMITEGTGANQIIGALNAAAGQAGSSSANVTVVIELLKETSEYYSLGNPWTFNKNYVDITIRAKAGESFTSTLTRGSGNTGRMFSFSGTNSSLTFENITIDGGSNSDLAGGILNVTGGTVKINSNATFQNSTYSGYGGIIYINGASAVVILNGGTLKNGLAAGNNGRGGAVCVNGGGYFTMNSCLITGCVAQRNTYYAGGAVCVLNSNNFVMNGGTISDCHARSTDGTKGSGGAFAIDHGNTATINGGLITDCTAANLGGAIEVHGDLRMTGGTITHCSSGKGGGINFYNNGRHIYLSGSPRIYGNYNSTDNEERNVDIYYHYSSHGLTTSCITVEGNLNKDAVVGVYNTESNNHAGCRFGRYNEDVSAENFYIFKNDNVQLRGGDYDTDRYLLWTSRIARVSTDGGTTWTYYDYLVSINGWYYTGGHNPSNLHHGNIPGAFTEANASTAPNVIIETLYKNGEFEDVINASGDTQIANRYAKEDPTRSSSPSRTRTATRPWSTAHRSHSPTCLTTTLPTTTSHRSAVVSGSSAHWVSPTWLEKRRKKNKIIYIAILTGFLIKLKEGGPKGHPLFLPISQGSP